MVRIPALPPHLDGYEGWEPDSPHPRIAKVRDTISADDMWTHFISQRRPVVIDGLLKDPDWKAARWTDLDYLKSVAGQAPVKIEPIHPAAGHFGTSVKRKKVKFASFLEMLQDPSDQGKWYLTTQYVDETEQANNAAQSAASGSNDQAGDDPDSEDSDNEPELDPVLPSPTDALSNDFPASPALLGNLVLQQCNLWLGNSKEGKSSGLHHDFHDNLYILLSGYKRFLLFPPSAHRFLHPRGLVDRVHPNGLIVYAPPGELPSYVPGRRPQLPIRPDGLVPSDAARWRRNARLRIKRDIDERAAADAGEGSRSRSQRKGKAKQTRAQELAEEALLQAEAELRICRLDEDGIDPEADTSDDAYDDDEDDDDDSDNQADLNGLLGIFADSSDRQAGQSSDDEDESATDAEDSDEEQQVQIRRLLDSLPDAMKPIAMASLAGDQASYHKLHDYLARIATSADSPPDSQREPDSSDPESDDHDDDASSDQDSAHHPSALRVPSNGVNKRKQASPSDDDTSSKQQDSDASDDIPKGARANTAKRVKISQRVDSIDAEQDQFGSSQSEDQDSDGPDPSLNGEATSGDNDDDNEDDDDDNDDDDEEPAFLAGAESSSEFGDVDEGEAELERLLALAEGDEPESEEDGTAEDDDNEPQSFSRIPPHVLHKVLNVPDDPSNPALPKNGTRNAGLKNGAQPERFTILPGCPPPMEVFLKPGQMLYLPASWYHEVTSSSSPPVHERVAATNSTAEPSKVHMALNYWFHPPDALEFEPVEPRLAQGRASDEAVVPGLGVALGESALENRGSGTGTHERPYRDAEVWDEVARAVEQQIRLARDRAR